MAADQAARLVVRRVNAVSVDRRGAGLQPDARRPASLRDAMAAPTARVDFTLESKISCRWCGVYRLFTLRPVRLITTSLPSTSLTRAPDVALGDPAIDVLDPPADRDNRMGPR